MIGGLFLVSEARKIIERFKNDFRSIEDTCGIYFLFKDDELVYIGQSTCVYQRIETHRGDKDFDRACYFPCPEGELTDIETVLIQGFAPRYNKTYNFGKYKKWGYHLHAADVRLAQDIAKRALAGKYPPRVLEGLVDLKLLERSTK